MLTALLLAEESLESHLSALSERREEFGGFNVICGELATLPRPDNNDTTAQLWYYCNDSPEGPRRLQRGVLYGVSNGHLDEWPKVERGKEAFQCLIDRQPLEREKLCSEALQIMSDRTRAEGDLHTGLPDEEWEQRLSSIFVEYMEKTYATMNTTVIMAGPQESRGEGVELEAVEHLHVDLETMATTSSKRLFACSLGGDGATPSWHTMAAPPANVTPQSLG